MTHSPGTWRFNPGRGEVLSDQPVHDGDDSLQHGYEGYVVAETVARANGPLLATAPRLLTAARELLALWESAHPFDREGGPTLPAYDGFAFLKVAIDEATFEGRDA